MCISCSIVKLVENRHKIVIITKINQYICCSLADVNSANSFQGPFKFLVCFQFMETDKGFRQKFMLVNLSNFYFMIFK